MKGVSLDSRTQKWVVHIRANGKKIHFGCFAAKEEAAAAYAVAAHKYHGEFANLAKRLREKPRPSLADLGLQ
jgi:hypothetical protein